MNIDNHSAFRKYTESIGLNFTKGNIITIEDASLKFNNNHTLYDFEIVDPRAGRAQEIHLNVNILKGYDRKFEKNILNMYDSDIIMSFNEITNTLKININNEKYMLEITGGTVVY